MSEETTTGCRVCGWEDYTPICPSCRNDAVRKIDEFVNRPTQTGSVEASVQGLVRRAVRDVVAYVERPVNPFTGEDNVKGRYTAEATVAAVEIVTNGELTEADFINAYGA